MKTPTTHREIMARAIQLASDNVESIGGPFGAVITRNGEIIAETANQVAINNDPTAHAEVEAIRLAGQALGNFDLSGCVMYASCEPCPMCLGAIYWAHIDKVYFAADRHDAARAGFNDSLIYEELSLTPEQRQVEMIQLEKTGVTELFDKWLAKEDKTLY